MSLPSFPDRQALGRDARELGYQIAHLSLEDLRRQRRNWVRLRDDAAADPTLAFVYGFYSALVELASAYDTVLQEQNERVEIVKAAHRRPILGAILQQIDRGKIRPGEIAQAIGKHVSMVSRAVRELEDVGLVKRAETPSGVDGRAELLGLSYEGAQVARALRGQKIEGVSPDLEIRPHATPEMFVANAKMRWPAIDPFAPGCAPVFAPNPPLATARIGQGLGCHASIRQALTPKIEPASLVRPRR